MPREDYNTMTDLQVHGPDLSSKYDRDDEVALRIHGLPFQATREEIYEFFADYKFVPDTLIFGLADDGRKSGLGSLIFENEEEAAKAAEEKDKQYIGSRFVNLRPISYGRYKSFNKDFVGRERETSSFGGGGGGSYGGDDAVKLSDHVNSENRSKALMMRGIPFRSTVDEIIGFFDGFEVKEEGITIEEMNGRRTGSVLVIFENTEKAQEAKEKLQKADLGGRYIDLFDENDSMMQRICRL